MTASAPALDSPLARDAQYLWHPWSPSRVTAETIVATHGHGCDVVDIDGRRYLDAKSSGLNATLGYGCTPVIDAATTQLRTLMTYDLGEGASLPSALLAEEIARLAGPDLTRTFFCSSGSEAVEAAIRIARFHHLAAGDHHRQLIVSLDRSYHGATLGAAAATGHAVPQGIPDPPGFHHLPTPRTDIDSHGLSDLQAFFDTHGHRVAAVILEPVSARTAHPLPHTYLAAMRALCSQFGALLILDEVTTGFGRTGTMFAYQDTDTTPDILCTSKGLGAGYTSIGAVTTTDAIFDRFDLAKNRAHFVHGHTHSGHATACATALAVLRYLQQEDIVDNVRQRSQQLLRALAPVAHSCSPAVSMHGRGLLLGLQFTSSAAASAVRERMLQDSVLVRRTGRTVLLAPPLIIDEGRTERLADACSRALRHLDHATA